MVTWDSAWPAFGWFAGGALLTILRSKRPGQGRLSCAEIEPELPGQQASPRSNESDRAAAWLSACITPPGAASSRSSTANVGILEHLDPAKQHNLPSGSLVCFYNEQGHLLVAKQNGREWELQAVPGAFHQEGPGLSFLPASSIFYVLKRGPHTGFRCYSANGCFLRAVKAPEGCHVLGGDKFGPWEQWELTPQGFVNSKTRKELRFTVKELRCFLVEDVRRFERKHVKDKAAMMDQIQLQTCYNKQMTDELEAMQGLMNERLAEREEVSQQYKEMQNLCHRHRADSLHRAAVISQLEHRLSDLVHEKEGIASALERAAREINQLESEAFKRDTQLERERFLNQQTHIREVEAIKAESRQALEDGRQAIRQREASLASILDKVEESMAMQTCELAALREERDRLDMALQSISGQMLVSPALTARDPKPIEPGSIRDLRRLLLPAEEVSQWTSVEASTKVEPAEVLEAQRLGSAEVPGSDEFLEEHSKENQSSQSNKSKLGRAQGFQGPADSATDLCTTTDKIDVPLYPSLSTPGALKLDLLSHSQGSIFSKAGSSDHGIPAYNSARDQDTNFLSAFAPGLGGSDKLMSLLSTSPTESISSIQTPRVLTSDAYTEANSLTRQGSSNEGIV